MNKNLKKSLLKFILDYDRLKILKLENNKIKIIYGNKRLKFNLTGKLNFNYFENFIYCRFLYFRSEA